MKKVIKFSLVAIAVSMSIVKAEASVETLNIYAIGDKKVNVNVSVVGKSTSYIQNEAGEVLFQRKLNVKESLNVTFDLSELNDGEYIFVMEDKYKKTSVPLEISDDQVMVYKNDARRVNFPQLSEENRLVAVKLIADETNDLYIDIKSEYGDLLFQEKIDGKLGLIGKRFKFESGRYLITLKSDDYAETKYLLFE